MEKEAGCRGSKAHGHIPTEPVGASSPPCTLPNLQTGTMRVCDSLMPAFYRSLDFTRDLQVQLLAFFPTFNSHLVNFGIVGVSERPIKTDSPQGDDCLVKGLRRSRDRPRVLNGCGRILLCMMVKQTVKVICMS